MKINPLTAIDFYKADHRKQYPYGTTEVYSNFTPRSSERAQVIRERFDEQIIFFGLQYFIKSFLMETWQKNFFDEPKESVLKTYKRRMDNALGKDAIELDHIAALHDLGYLPLQIKALPEGAQVPIGVPVLTVVNTHPDFFWLTNYIESVLANHIWKPTTSATLAFEYKKLFTDFAIKTGSPLNDIPFQAHDFSFRGMSGIDDASRSGAGHLTSFWGTDTVSAIDLLEQYYCCDSDIEPVGFSVPATEHSVMCMGTQLGEIDTFRRLINQIYPRGLISIVSDTWDFWKVITEFTVILKEDILKRDGKVVFRPDSGDPLKIICGDPQATKGSAEYKGAIECLYEVFGGTITKTGYKLLDAHIGLIYGDGITLERAQRILQGLADKGFASTNIVFGVGSLTYQFTSRDSFGFAMKATSGVVHGERRDIFKSPKTDSGTKKSAKGLLRVEQEHNRFVLYDNQTIEQEQQGALTVIFKNGKLIKEYSLKEIRLKLEHALDTYINTDKL